ncbi:DUF262 domain-containing protein [Vibrio cholerae]|uniref:DUF262 domain-containing protein n=1 Tax=Vibrio cholerae TaxID=666 RepID=UPI0027387693|nr:DUF262 domain-containing protein [Vibrio cholerae]MDP4497653.1 DUF262 domain-containing protein [Vibrio cholerae]WLP78754.1 DUF262 domain-containing protein [Vibrio cholerae]
MLEDFQVSEEAELNEEITQVPKEVRKLRTQPYDKSIIDLMGMIERREIDLRPNFQRNTVWDTKRASLLIESIWLNIPIPQIFVSVEEDGMWNVIDGQQRLTSLWRYYKNEFKLRGLEVLSELNGFNYSSLDDKPQRLLHGGNIRIVAIHEDSHPDIKFDVFMRINQGAVQLNAQELRNCLYRGDLNDSLHELVNNQQLLSILKLSKPHNRFKDIEMILRYFSVSDSYSKDFENYPGVMKKFLNDFMLSNRNISCSLIDKNKRLFTENLNKVYSIFGDDAFRKWDKSLSQFDSKLNLSLMDCQMLAVERYSISEIETHRVVLKDKFISIFESNEPIEFHDAITTGTSSKIKLEYRVSFLIKIFDEIMG